MEKREDNRNKVLDGEEIYYEMLRKYSSRRDEEKNNKKIRSDHRYTYKTQVLCHYGTPCDEPDRGDFITEDEGKLEEDISETQKKV